MKLTQERALGRLRGDLPCRAAIFLSYTFDPVFFEEQVLASILHLESDPDELPARYHDEALRALQEIPVACLVDESVRRPGRRLPYDLRGVRGRTFHPKVVLLVFDELARLQVGSCNLTRSGYGGNSELAFVRDLRFDDTLDMALLREVLTVIEAADRLASPGGTQLAAALELLASRASARPERDRERRDLHFLHTEGGEPLLQQFLSLLPEEARVTRVGALAPFLEKDDADWEADGEATSVLGALAGRLGKDAALDLGLAWERNPVACAPDRVPPFEQALGELWARSGEDGAVEYFTPTRLTTNQLRFQDAAGEPRAMPLEEAEELRAARATWPVEKVEAYAPERIVQQLRSLVPLHVWLHPAVRVQGGRRLSRPLHGKLLLVAVRRRGVDSTFVLMGSPNLSRRALLHTPQQGGNVETALAFAVPGHLTLRDVAPELVHYTPRAPLRERDFPEPPRSYGHLVVSALYRAELRQLSVHWSIPADEPPPPQEWVLHYAETELARGADWPRGQEAQTVIEAFDLGPSTCELVLRVGQVEAHVPILVEDLHALPAGPGVLALELRDLLALLGRRIGAERLLSLRAGAADGKVVDAVLTGILGEGFGPSDVFRAWWGLAAELSRPDLSPSGFRRSLWGALGARAVWERLREAGQSGALGADEAWFYGAELRRTLASVTVPEGPDRRAKRALLREFLDRLSAEVDAIQPAAQGRAWVGELVAFYGGTR